MNQSINQSISQPHLVPNKADKSEGQAGIQSTINHSHTRFLFTPGHKSIFPSCWHKQKHESTI